MRLTGRLIPVVILVILPALLPPPLAAVFCHSKFTDYLWNSIMPLLRSSFPPPLVASQQQIIL
jgi:hypothetical protein